MNGWRRRWWQRATGALPRPTVPAEVIGLVAAVVLFVAIAGTVALQTPPFTAPDETAHLGYAYEVASFHLPTIETTPEIPGSATQWQAESDSREDDRYRAVWVANHPPLNYIAVAPLLWLADATDRPDGGLMFLRVANVVFAAIGIVLTYLFACEVTGGMRRVALAAATLVALLPQGHALFSAALNDGIGFAAGAFVLWAAARCVRRGVNRQNLVVLGAAATTSFGARASTMLMATVVVGLVGLLAAWQQRTTWAARLRTVASTAAIGLGPAVVLFGWFYVRNVRLYGDIGGSAFLLDRFGRSNRGSVLTMFHQGHRWVDLYHKLFSPSPTFSVAAPPGTNVAAIAAVCGLVVAVVLGRTGDRPGPEGNARVSRPILALGAASLGVIAFTVAQHMSGGGNAYARYLFPCLAVLGTFAAIGFDRIVPRLAPAVAMGALGWWAWINVPTSVDLGAIRRPRDRGRVLPDELRIIPSSPWMRDTLFGVGVAASVVLAVVMVVGLAGPVTGAVRRVVSLPPRAGRPDERSTVGA